VKNAPFTITVATIILIVFGVEILTHTVGGETSLLGLGALPDSGQLRGEYWRFATYSFLHLNWLHLIANVLLLLWIGRILEGKLGSRVVATIYVCSVVASAVAIILVHGLHPHEGATMGASGGVFGLLAGALILTHSSNRGSFEWSSRLRRWVWVALIIGLAVSLLPGVSLAGHIGGIIGGAIAAYAAPLRTA